MSTDHPAGSSSAITVEPTRAKTLSTIADFSSKFKAMSSNPQASLCHTAGKSACGAAGLVFAAESGKTAAPRLFSLRNEGWAPERVFKVPEQRRKHRSGPEGPAQRP